MVVATLNPRSGWSSPPSVAAFVLTYALTCVGALTSLPRQIEHERDLFVADHVRREAFLQPSAIVLSEPPLVPQLVGLVGRVMPLERGYALLLVVSALLCVLGAAGLAWAHDAPRRENEAVGSAALAGALCPATYLLLFPWAEAPFALALGLGALAATGLEVALRAGTWRSAAWVWALGGGVAALCAHPVGALPFVASASLGARRSEGRGPRALACLLVVGVGGWVAWPHVAHGLRGFPAGTMPLGVGLSWSGAALLAGLRHRRARSLLVVGAALSVAASIMGDAWSGPVLAIGTLTSALAWACVSAPSPIEHGLRAAGAWAAVLAGGFVLASAPGGDSRPHRKAISEATLLLATDARPYAMLGLGPEGLELRRRLDRPPLDPPGSERLAAWLADAPRWGLGWVVAAERSFNPALESAGFVVRQAWRGGVVLWEHPKVQTPTTSAVRLGEPPPRRLLWAVAPLLTLTLGLAGAGWSLLGGRRRA